MGGTHTRAMAFDLLEAWTKGESLRKHALAVSVCTEAYGAMEAARLGLAGAEAEGLVERYASAGLLHDMDYERHPSLTEHPFVGVAALRELGWPETVLHAILAHPDYSGAARDSNLDKALFACDELAGFLTACALVKPTKSILDVEVKGAALDRTNAKDSIRTFLDATLAILLGRSGCATRQRLPSRNGKNCRAERASKQLAQLGFITMNYLAWLAGA